MSDKKYLPGLVIKNAILHSSPKQGNLLFVSCGKNCLNEWCLQDVEEVSVAGTNVKVCLVEGLTIASVNNICHPVSEELRKYFLDFDAVIYVIPAETVRDESIQQLRDRFSDVATSGWEYSSIFTILVYDPLEELSTNDLFAKLDFINAPLIWRFYEFRHWDPLFIVSAINYSLETLTLKFRGQLRYEGKKERRDYRADWQRAYNEAAASNSLVDPGNESEDHQSRQDGAFNTWEGQIDLDHSPTPSPPSSEDDN